MMLFKKTVSIALIILFLITQIGPRLGVSLGGVDLAEAEELSDTQPIGNLLIGDRVVDNSWMWEHKTGNNYSGEGKTKPITWIVVAKDHYDVEGGYSHVTLMSEELIGLYPFDDSRDRGDVNGGSNHWGDSGTTDAKHGLRPFLNSLNKEDGFAYEGDGFYNTFPESFKDAVVTTNVPNKDWENDEPYTTQDNVFVLTREEMGKSSDIKDKLPFFYSPNPAQAAMLDGTWRYYSTRSPSSSGPNRIYEVTKKGDLNSINNARNNRGIRPVLNIKSDTPVSATPNSNNAYDLGVTSISPDSVKINTEAFRVVVGTERKIVAICEPDYASNKSVIWESSDEQIASIDENGVVTGISPGTATITVTTVDNNHTDSSTVTVLPKSEEFYISDLFIGDRVTDESWLWEHRTGNNYTETGEVKPVTWIVVAKDHYDVEGEQSHVTLLSEELLGRYTFDNSSEGNNNWGNSGTADATHGLRPFLNSLNKEEGYAYEEDGFYESFSDDFKDAVLTTKVPNREWQYGNPYTTEDKVFVPSTTELGDTEHEWTIKTGTVFPFFDGKSDASRIAKLGDTPTGWSWGSYWTRSPRISKNDIVRAIRDTGSFSSHDYYSASASWISFRPVVNLAGETSIPVIPDNDGNYALNSAYVLPTEAIYAIGSGEDLVITLVPYSRTLNIISDEDSNLTENVDFMADGNSYTILADYLENKGTGFITLTFEMDTGTNPTVSVMITEMGDVNGNGRVEVQDAILVLRHIVGLEILDEEKLKRSRMRGKQDITVQDAILILRKIVGFE